MLIRTSGKFRRQYRRAIDETDSPVRPFPQTWNVDLIGNGPRQLIVLASEEYTLFSILVLTERGRNTNIFLDAFRQRLLQVFEDTRIHSADRPDLNQFTFVGRTDKRIIGSQNDLIYLARCHLAETIQPATHSVLREVKRQINDAPMSYLGMDHPLNALQKKVEWLKAGCVPCIANSVKAKRLKIAPFCGRGENSSFYRLFPQRLRSHSSAH